MIGNKRLALASFKKRKSRSTRHINAEIALAVAFFLPVTESFHLKTVKHHYTKAKRQIVGVKANREYYRAKFERFFREKALENGVTRKKWRAFFGPTSKKFFTGTQLRVALALYYASYHSTKLTNQILSFFETMPADKMFKPGPIYLNVNVLGIFACYDDRLAKKMFKRLL